MFLMSLGFSFNLCDIPDELLDRHRLRGRICHRLEGAEPEVHFMSRHRPRLLPAWYGNDLRILRWGCADQRFPASGLLNQEEIDAGQWSQVNFEIVQVPAVLILDRGVWYPAKEGIKGLVSKISGELCLFVLMQESTHYYRIMTKGEKMPVFVGEQI